MTNAPERAHVLISKISADTAYCLANELRFLADQIERKALTTGCNGSPSGGAIYSYKIRPEQTHDVYFQEVEKYLAALRSSATNKPSGTAPSSRNALDKERG